MEPSFISEGDDDAEALTVKIWAGGFPIRLICWYGSQEGDTIQRKNKFWKYLDDEVHKARVDGAAIVIQMDGNLWAGCDIIKGDPKTQNTKLLQNFLAENPF